MKVVLYTVSLILINLRKLWSKICILKTLKQIFQLESIPCVYLHDILKRLLANICFEASFMCLSRFVAFRITFTDLCYGLLSRIHLRVTD